MPRGSRKALLGISSALVVATVLVRIIWPAPSDQRELYSAECELHGVRTEEDIVPLHYGTVLLVNPSIQVDGDREEYPNANPSARGGCIVGDAKRARVRYCPECRRVRAAAES